MERKILQAKGALIAVGEAVAYGKTCRFCRPVSKEELDGLNLLLAQAEYKNIDLEKAHEDEELSITLEWKGKNRVFSIDPVIVTRAA